LGGRDATAVLSNQYFAAAAAAAAVPKPSPAAPKARRIVHHEKERRRRDPQFASNPAPGVNAGRVHRRGLDGPSMQKPLSNISNAAFVPTVKPLPARAVGDSDWRG
jgi:hypothetical protein